MFVLYIYIYIIVQSFHANSAHLHPQSLSSLVYTDILLLLVYIFYLFTFIYFYYS